LDAAERLFGERGYDGVGMRELASMAKVNLGAVTYHFGSKESLYIETFLRRFRPANADRLRLLQKAEAVAQGRPLEVEQIVDCMVRPPYLQGLEHPEFHALLARNLFFPPPFLLPELKREIGANIEVFITALRRSLPHLPEDLLRWRELFSMGALSIFSLRIAMAEPPRNPQLEESILRELVRFISAGLKSEPAAPAGARPLMPGPPQPHRG
jgi:AcrR family transcriptional regulator